MVAGLTHTWLIDEKSYLKTVVGGSLNKIKDNEDELTMDSVAIRLQTGEFSTYRMNLHSSYSRKFNNKLRMKTGVMLTNMHHNLFKQNRVDTLLVTDLNHVSGFTQLFQAYAQLSFRPTEYIMLNAGLHASMLTLNTTGTVEPRFSAKFQLAKRTSITAAYGLHGQMLPIGAYLLEIDGQQPNKNLKMAQSHHGVIGFEQIIGNNVRILLEGYYQQLFNVPVSVTDSTFWFFNMRDNYGNTALTSDGKGRNYGVDLSIEKAFRNHFSVLGSASLKRSLYTAMDGIERRTRMDNIWNTTLMGGYEFEFKDGGALDIGIKSFVSGGLRYTPIDATASTTAEALVFDNSRPFGESLGTYFRLDSRIAYRRSAKKISYSIAIEIQNTTNQKNLFEKQCHRQSGTIDNRYHSGTVPGVFFVLNF